MVNITPLVRPYGIRLTGGVMFYAKGIANKKHVPRRDGRSGGSVSLMPGEKAKKAERPGKDPITRIGWALSRIVQQWPQKTV